MIDESMQLHGAMPLILRRASGEVETVHKDNIIVNVGWMRSPRPSWIF